MKNRSALVTGILSILLSGALYNPTFGWANSENSCYTKGDMLGSAGISFIHLGVYAAFDYAVHDCISAGVAAGYNGYTRPGELRINQAPLALRAAFHPFNLGVLADKILIRNMVDVYAGFSTGWVFRWQPKHDTNFDTPSDFFIREYLGLRYYFSDNLGIFVEDCGDMATLAFGVTYKF